MIKKIHFVIPLTYFNVYNINRIIALVFLCFIPETQAVELVGCNVDDSLCNSDGGQCLYNGLCVCNSYYHGDTCQLSKLNSNPLFNIKV